MESSSKRKKVLVITYYWPPCGGIGVLRNLKFVKYLREFGWEPIVYTVENPSYPFLDYQNEKEIPEGITVLKGKIWEPLHLFKKISGRKKSDTLQNITANTSSKKSWIDDFGIWVRGNFFVPDARAGWIKPSIKTLSEYLKDNPVDAILTDGPPHTNTVIGMRIAQKFNIPWLADFQDPWTQVDYYKLMNIGELADKKHKRLEQEAFQTAKKITIASPSWKRDIENIGAKNVDVIYYGYDEADFESFQKQKTDYFKIFHAGLLGNDRNISCFFEVIKEILVERPELHSIIRLDFAGEVDFSNKQAVTKNELDQITTFHGMIPRKEVIAHYETSSVLLLPINQAENAQGRIPGKLFECMRTYSPILIFGPSNGDVKQIVESKKSGISVEYQTEKELQKNYLLALIDKHLKGIQLLESNDISEFSNYELTKKLAGYLDEIS